MDWEPTKTRTWAGMPTTLIRLGISRKWAHPLPSLALRVPWSGFAPVGGPAFELLVLNGPYERFQLYIPPYLRWFLAHRPSKPLSGVSFDGTARDSVCTIFGGR